MTFQGIFAVISEYKKKVLKGNVQLHTVILSDSYTRLPEMFAYKILKPESIPYEELKSFLKSEIPKNCDVYASDGYYKKYSLIIKGLGQRYTFKSINDASEEIREDLILCFARANNDMDIKIRKRIKKTIDAVFEVKDVGETCINKSL